MIREVGVIFSVIIGGKKWRKFEAFHRPQQAFENFGIEEPFFAFDDDGVRDTKSGIGTFSMSYTL
jgi:hypothetical protein